MSGLDKTATTTNLGDGAMPGNSIRFAPFGQAPRAPEGRAFVIQGEYDPQALNSAIAFLVCEVSRVFKDIELSEGNLRIVLQHNYGWLVSLPFFGDTPPAIAVIHEKVGEVGDVTVLAYTLFVLCTFLDWDVRDVRMGEASVGS